MSDDGGLSLQERYAPASVCFGCGPANPSGLRLRSVADPTGEHALPFDALGHGTQTMGLMVGGDAGGTAIGVAPDATWIAAKIFDDAGEATLSGIHLAFQWLLDPDGDPDTDDAPDVVNNSWNLTGTVNQCVSEFAADIDLLKAAGIAIAFSASNLGPASPSSVSPANGSGFAVGAVNGSLGIASFSSRGPSACDGGAYPQVVAPGVSVRQATLNLSKKIEPLHRVLYGRVSG